MRKLLLFILFASIMLTSCKSNHSETNKKIVTVSILPQKYFIEKIAGNTFEINVLIPPGASPVTYEPTARQMADISNSEFYFKIGQIEFEKVWSNKIKSNNPDLKIIDVSKNIDFMEGHHHETEHGHENHNHTDEKSLDPHIWMSPRIVKKIAENIYSELKNSTITNIDSLEKNYKDFLKEVNSVDSLVKSKVSNLNSRSFMIFHPALSYFAKDYNLEQIAIEIEGKDPSPTHIKKIIDEAIEKDIKIIFIQKQFDKENAETIAKEIGAQVIQIDPLAYDWNKSIIDVTEKLTEAL